MARPGNQHCVNCIGTLSFSTGLLSKSGFVRRLLHSPAGMVGYMFCCCFLFLTIYVMPTITTPMEDRSSPIPHCRVGNNNIMAVV